MEATQEVSCGVPNADQQGALAETELAHAVQITKCKVCHKSFKTHVSYAAHLRSSLACTLNGKVKCDQCGCYFAKRSLKPHMWSTCPKRKKGNDAANKPVATAPPSLLAAALEEIKELKDTVQRNSSLHRGHQIELQIMADEMAALKAELSNQRQWARWLRAKIKTPEPFKGNA